MRLFFFLSIWLFSACMSPHEVSPSEEESSTQKIQENQSKAEHAINEYKALQAQRTLEY